MNVTQMTTMSCYVMNIDENMQKTELISSMIEINMIRIMKQQADFNERQRVCRMIANSRFFGPKRGDPVQLDRHVYTWECQQLLSKVHLRTSVLMANRYAKEIAAAPQLHCYDCYRTLMYK